MKLKLDDIVIEDRFRDVAPGAVKTIAESFKLIGQSVPVLVYKTENNKYRLIDGGHRIAAARELGWSEISAELKDFEDLDEQEIEFARRIIEIDTTIARSDLSTGLETDLLERRLRVIVEKNAYDDAKKAKQEADEANKKRAEALKAEKAAESEKAKKIAKAALDKAEQERKNAAQRAIAALERASEVGDAIPKERALPDNLYGVGKARTELALQTNRKPDTIKKAMQWFDVLGRDFVRKLHGTELDNNMQYLAMSRLKKRYDETTAEGFKRPSTPDGKVQAMADRLVQSYWPRFLAHIVKFKEGEADALPNPHAEYADIIRDEKQGFKTNEEIRRLETVDGQWDRVRDYSAKLYELLMSFETALKAAPTDPRIKTKAPLISRMRSQADELRLWAKKG